MFIQHLDNVNKLLKDHSHFISRNGRFLVGACEPHINTQYAVIYLLFTKSEIIIIAKNLFEQ